MMHTVGMRSFLTSSRHRLPKPTLLGYAFQGADLVIDDDGMRQYGDVHPGDDGSYIAVTRTWNTATVGTDSAGYSRLYAYRDGANWIVGSSFIEVAETAADNNWPLTPRPSTFDAFTMRGSVGNQLITHSTAFCEIALLPAGQNVTISGLRPKLTRIAVPNVPEGTYQQHLVAYVTELIGRMRTLIRSGLPVCSEITGGKDSRVVLAALLAAHESQVPLGEVVRFRSDPRALPDIRVAEALSAEHGLLVNSRRSPGGVPMSGQESLNMWRTHDLGVYGPIYFPKARNKEVTLGGAGGEGHRLFYRASSMDAILRSRQPEHVTEADHSKLIARVSKELSQVGVGAERGMDRRILHYRYFRDRLHGGRQTLRSVTLAPLSGRRLRAASALVSGEHRERGQVIADLLLNLSPDLAHAPYDAPSKTLDSQHVAEHVSVGAVASDAQGGHVFGGDRFEEVSQTVGGPGPFDLLAERFGEDAFHARKSGWVPHAVVSAAAVAVGDAAQVGRFGHASDGQAVSTTVLASEVSRLAK